MIPSFTGNNGVLSRERESYSLRAPVALRSENVLAGFAIKTQVTRSEADSNSSEPVKFSTKISPN